MVGDYNLQDVMNEVSTGLASGRITAPVSLKLQEPLTEIQAFAALDPLLAGLQKEYLDARAIRLKSQQDYGLDDAMTDMAQWSEDSAWCAMQTRYLEVRDDRIMMKSAQNLMHESVLEYKEAQQREKEKDALKLLAELKMFDRMHEAQNKSYLHVWVMCIILLDYNDMLRNLRQPTYQFNRLAA